MHNAQSTVSPFLCYAQSLILPPAPLMKMSTLDSALAWASVKVQWTIRLWLRIPSNATWTTSTAVCGVLYANLLARRSAVGPSCGRGMPHSHIETHGILRLPHLPRFDSGHVEGLFGPCSLEKGWQFRGRRQAHNAPVPRIQARVRMTGGGVSVVVSCAPYMRPLLALIRFSMRGL